MLVLVIVAVKEALEVQETVPGSIGGELRLDGGGGGGGGALGV